jgi:hypothetical protein
MVYRVVTIVRGALLSIIMATPNWVPERVIRPVALTYLRCVQYHVKIDKG